MKVLVDMESSGGNQEILGHGSMAFNELHMVVMRKYGGSEGDPGFWLMN